MQLSHVWDQRLYFGVGDTDDCGPVSATQCVHAVAPWLHLVSVKDFRAHAGNPDDPNAPDGFNLAQIVRGTEGAYPDFAGKLTKLRNVTWSTFTTEAARHRPMSVAVTSAKLPPRIRFGFAGAHQISLFVKPSGQILCANPLAHAYSRLEPVTWAEMKPAILDYGNGGVWAVAYPTEEQMLPLHPQFRAAMEAAMGPAIQAARAEGYAQAKASAVSAVMGI